MSDRTSTGAVGEGRVAGAAKEPVPSTPSAPVSPEDVLSFVARASVAMMNSNVRYWQRWAETSIGFYPRLSQSLQETASDPDRRVETQAVMLDELRAYFRQMAELPSQEARRLAQELDELARATMAPGATETDGAVNGDGDDPCWKRHRVKR